MKLFMGFGAAACLACLAPLASADDAAHITATPPALLEWEHTPEGVQFASLDGDRFAGSYMAMVRLPAGLVSPPHVKSAAMYGIVLEGTMVHETIGEMSSEPRELKAGAFYKIPEGLAHVSKCVSQTDCVTFLYQDGAFDFLPAGEAPR